MKFHVWHDGDGSVGIPGEQATVEIDVESYAEEVRGDYIEQARDMLQRGFSGLWDTHAKVMTADEVRREAEACHG